MSEQEEFDSDEEEESETEPEVPAEAEILRFKFEGPALKDGWMRVRDFGPALTALGEGTRLRR